MSRSKQPRSLDVREDGERQTSRTDGDIETAALVPKPQLDVSPSTIALHFEIEADDPLLDRMKYVVEAHIVRFAFREKLKKLNWY